MVHASQQLSPSQLLESGHRAEGEGKLDLAAQFYRHLTEHYAYTGEAAEARNGLGRIGAAQTQVWQMNGTSHGHVAEPVGRPGAARVPRRRPVVPRDHYRTGRALAALISGAGWLTVLLGLAVPFVSLLPGVSVPYLALPQLVGAAVGTCVLGLVLVFTGQAARALFDQANATRELVALERAKIGHD